MSEVKSDTIVYFMIIQALWSLRADFLKHLKWFFWLATYYTRVNFICFWTYCFFINDNAGHVAIFVYLLRSPKPSRMTFSHYLIKLEDVILGGLVLSSYWFNDLELTSVLTIKLWTSVISHTWAWNKILNRLSWIR